MPVSPPSSVRGGFPLGLAGATAATRYVGATASGAPTSGTFAVGDFVVTQDGSLYICTAAGSPGTWAAVSGGGGLFDAYALLRDEQPAGTDGGTFTAGAWRTRTLNTEAFDVGGFVTLAANQFTLAAGSYWLYGRAPAFIVGRHKSRIQNVTDGATALVGSDAYVNAADANAMSDSVVQGRVVIADAKAFELQHFSEGTTATFGFGLASSFTLAEIYAEVQIWREA